MYNKITIVVASRHTHEEKAEFLEMIDKTCECEFELCYVLNKDGVGLTKVYSDMLDKSETDVVVFIHDDIEFLKSGWGAEILRLFNEHTDYGIIGVAGSAEFDKRGAWWNYKNKFGQVLHRADGKAWLTAFSPLLDKDLEDVVVVDGLFMAVCKDRISQKFDTTIKGFHMYDIDFCLANYLDKKTKIGVTTNIRLAHNSVGELSEGWHDNLLLVNNKYKNNYPIKISKKNDR